MYVDKVYCDVISHAYLLPTVQEEHFFLHSLSSGAGYQEALLSHQEILRQNFPIICPSVCQEMMEKIKKDLPSWVDYVEAPATDLFCSMCILLHKM